MPELTHVKHSKQYVVDLFLDGLARVTTPIALSYLWRPQLQDASDEMVLESAVNGMASALLTWNVRDFQAAARRFGLRVAAPDRFWKGFSEGLR